MLRVILIAAAAGLGLASHAAAMDMKCDEATMMKMQTEMDAITDPAKMQQKERAMKEVAMAKDAMAANKTDECVMHMDAAHKEMMKTN